MNFFLNKIGSRITHFAHATIWRLFIVPWGMNSISFHSINFLNPRWKLMNKWSFVNVTSSVSQWALRIRYTSCCIWVGMRWAYTDWHHMAHNLSIAQKSSNFGGIHSSSPSRLGSNNVWFGTFCSNHSWAIFVLWGLAKSCLKIQILELLNKIFWSTRLPFFLGFWSQQQFSSRLYWDTKT